MNKTAEAFLKIAESYENLARCEPDFNDAQHLRFMARHFKEEARRLAPEKDKEDGSTD